MGKAKQPVNIAGIEFDALIDQTLDYSADVPEYPTEKGFSVSDNISLKPEVLSMTLFVTDTPVTWKKRFGSGAGRVGRIINQLQNLYFSKKTVTVTTSEATYTDMAITNISFTKSSDVGYASEIPITLKKVIVTSTSTTTIPDSYGKSGASGASSGTANTSSAGGAAAGSAGGGSGGSSGSGSSNKKDSSILYNVASSVGLLS